jgi:polyisoprenoid-binding protein YceI
LSAGGGGLARSAATLVLALGLATSAPADAPSFAPLLARSSLSFTGIQQGEQFTGTIRDFDARVLYAPDQLPSSRIDATIRLKSLDTGNEERDQALAGADWFDFAQFPTASFRAATIRATPTGLVGEAELTIKGHTKRLAFPFSWKTEGSGATLDARVTLDRLDFGLGAGEWADESIVGRQIEVIVHLELTTAVPSIPAGSSPAANPAAPATQPRSANN